MHFHQGYVIELGRSDIFKIRYYRRYMLPFNCTISGISSSFGGFHGISACLRAELRFIDVKLHKYEFT